MIVAQPFSNDSPLANEISKSFISKDLSKLFNSKLSITWFKINLEIIDNYNLNGDYIESQAFGFLAIRSFLNLPISFHSTTGCEMPSVGGKLVKNF